MSRNQATTRGDAGLSASPQGLTPKTMTMGDGALSGAYMRKTGTRGGPLEPAALGEGMTQVGRMQAVANGFSLRVWLQDHSIVKEGAGNPLAEEALVAEEDAPPTREAGMTRTGVQARATAAVAAIEDGGIGAGKEIKGIVPQGATIVVTAGGPATAKRRAGGPEPTHTENGPHPPARRRPACSSGCNPCYRNK